MRVRDWLVAAAVLMAPAGAAGQVGKSQGVLDPNIAWEQDKRPFLSMTELDPFLGGSLTREQRTGLYGKLFLAINLNSAPREEILLIPGVGNRMAREFLEYRPYDGLARFRREIGKYVDAKEVARLEQYGFVPIKLNTASDEDILSIPGVGPRMLREFKEYRPYRNIEQFRREIAKYVNAKELARLERYVTVN